MWHDKLQNVYSNLKEFQAYSDIYGLAKRLGYKSASRAWKANPHIQGSCVPGDYGKYKNVLTIKN